MPTPHDVSLVQDLTVLPWTPGWVVCLSHGGRSAILPTSLADAMTGCGTIVPRAEFERVVRAAAIDAARRSPDVADVRPRDAGALASAAIGLADGFADRASIDASTAPDRRPPLTLGVIGGRGAAAALDTIDALVRDCGASSFDAIAVVCRNTGASAAPDTIRRETRAREDRWGVRIEWVDDAARTAVETEIAALADVPLETVRACTRGHASGAPDTGAIRNTLQLWTIGRRVFSFDDDVRGIGWSPRRIDGVGVSSDLPITVAPYRSSHEARQQVTGSGAEAVAGHARLLGVPARDLATDRHAHVGPSQAWHGRVTVTLSGSAGDSGASSSWQTLLLGEDGPPLTRHLVASRDIVRVAPRTTLTDHPWVMTLAYGFDNTADLPPFMPAFRNQDAVFGRALLTSRDACLAHVPTLVHHCPPEPRTPSLQGLFATCRDWRVGDVILEIEDDHLRTRLAGRYARTGLGGLARHLTELAALPAGEFLYEVLRIYKDGRVRHLEAIEQVRRSRSRALAAPAIARLLRQAAKQVTEAMRASAPPRPTELATADDWVARLQRECLAVAEVYRVWPRLRRAASRATSASTGR